MLGLSSSCDATVRLTRKASIPEKPGDVKEFDKGKRWNAVLPGGKSDDTMFLPIGKSDAPCGAMCAFGTLRFICHYEALSFHSVQRTLSLRSTALRCCGNLPEGTPHYKTHARYFCTCVEKKGANKHKSEHCRPDNAISKAQFAPRDLHFSPFFDIYCFYFGGVILLDSLFLMLRNLLIFSSYVENKNSFPKPLSREKEAEYVLRAENGDKEATELLIRHNLRLVAHIAKKYCNYPDTDELISIGSIGLIKAIRTYKSGKGTALATYAAKCIENEILMTLRVNKKHKNNVSLNDPVGTDRDGNELTIIDMLSTDEEGVITDVENRMLIEKVSEIVKTSLDKREYEIIVMRYGLNDTPSLTQREVAEKFGISRSYISRIEKKALQKIKSAIEKNDFDFT